jgi:acetoin utilization deacetylase AcuC-like enzyme
VSLLDQGKNGLLRAWRGLRSWARQGDVRFVIGRHYELELPGSTYDALRSQRILSFLLAERLTARRAVHQARPASMRALRRVHGDEYLESLQEPGSLVPILGYSLSEDEHDHFLLAHRDFVAGSLLATRLALSNRGVAVNLGGGFHHARADFGHGFCAFNDIAVAIAKRRAAGFRAPVLVIDLDLHDGDGTRSIFARDSTVHTFSIHNRHLGETEAVASTSIELGSDVEDGPYLAAVRESLPPVLRSSAPGLVYYLAGCDPARDDALGDWRISSRGLQDRDRFVMDLIGSLPGRIPVVVLLAGGYGQDAWRHSARFLATLAGHPNLEPPRTTELTLAHYRRISALLSVSELTAQPYGDGWQLEESDLLPAPNAPLRSSRLLGYYSRHGIELALERYGIYERLRKKGFDDLVVELELEDPAAQTLRIRAAGPARERLAEIRLRKESQLLPGMELLAVEWLLLQNPRARFGASRHRLPGQRYPGLGMLREVSALLVLVCERLGLDGLVIVPSHYHVAALTSNAFRFVEPEEQARFVALRAALHELRLLEAAHVIEEGRVIDRANGEPFRWVPAPMVHAVSPRLRRTLAADDFDDRAAEARRGLEFELVDQ